LKPSCLTSSRAIKSRLEHEGWKLYASLCRDRGDAGPDKAIGVWFPDLPGGFSAGDSIEEAMLNAPEAVAAYAEALETDGRQLPPPGPLSELRNDPAVAGELREHMIALIPTAVTVLSAAE
jgi:predicted RNase H-like HicB family nuclease